MDMHQLYEVDPEINQVVMKMPKWTKLKDKTDAYFLQVVRLFSTMHFAWVDNLYTLHRIFGKGSTMKYGIKMEDAKDEK